MEHVTFMKASDLRPSIRERYGSVVDEKSRQELLDLFYSLAEQDEPYYQHMRLNKSAPIERMRFRVASRLYRVEREQATLADPEYYAGYEAGRTYGRLHPRAWTKTIWRVFSRESVSFIVGAQRGIVVGRQEARDQGQEEK